MRALEPRGVVPATAAVSRRRPRSRTRRSGDAPTNVAAPRPIGEDRAARIGASQPRGDAQGIERRRGADAASPRQHQLRETSCRDVGERRLDGAPPGRCVRAERLKRGEWCGRDERARQRGACARQRHRECAGLGIERGRDQAAPSTSAHQDHPGDDPLRRRKLPPRCRPEGCIGEREAADRHDAGGKRLSVGELAQGVRQVVEACGAVSVQRRGRADAGDGDAFRRLLEVEALLVGRGLQQHEGIAVDRDGEARCDQWCSG